jgi:hypothetical protein
MLTTCRCREGCQWRRSPSVTLPMLGCWRHASWAPGTQRWRTACGTTRTACGGRWRRRRRDWRQSAGRTIRWFGTRDAIFQYVKPARCLFRVLSGQAVSGHCGGSISATIDRNHSRPMAFQHSFWVRSYTRCPCVNRHWLDQTQANMWKAGVHQIRLLALLASKMPSRDLRAWRCIKQAVVQLEPRGRYSTKDT